MKVVEHSLFTLKYMYHVNLKHATTGPIYATKAKGMMYMTIVKKTVPVTHLEKDLLCSDLDD